MLFKSHPYLDWEVEFIYSPLFEMLCSLHLICNPAHHLRHIEWAERVRSEMEPSFLAKLEEHYEDFNGWCSAMEFCDHHADLII